MKNYIYIFICLALAACAKNEEISQPRQDRTIRLTVQFECQSMDATRAHADETRIDDINLYLFPANGDPARHIYITTLRPEVVELPKGEYTLYAAANIGTDMGDLTQQEISALHIERDPATLATLALPMTAKQGVSVYGNTSINVSLARAVAKVNFTCSLAPDLADALRIKSVQLRSAPRRATLFSRSRVLTAAQSGDSDKITPSGPTFSAVYYLLENCQGQNTAITDQKYKDHTHAPEFATYLLIEGETDAMKVAYRIYLGQNNTTDFNVVRNYTYNIDIRILGVNTVDWRVSTAELSLAPFEKSYRPGQSAKSRLQLTCTNSSANRYFLSYSQQTGEGTVTVNGQTYNPDTPYLLFSGSGTAYADLTYTQQMQGDAVLRFTVTDSYGSRIEKVLTTTYINPVLSVQFTQNGNILAAQDRATVSYTVNQPGYIGKYTVRTTGTPSLFRNMVSDLLPATFFSILGDGNYSLRIKPEAVGDNPYTVTITDQRGNSTSFDSSVTGVKTTSEVSVAFNKGAAGYLEVLVDCSYPISEKLDIEVSAYITFTLSGGKIYADYYTIPVQITAGESIGRATMNIGAAITYVRYSIASLKAVFSQTTSENGMVEYVLKKE